MRECEGEGEGNANVRATMELVSGDETRAWQWTGSTANINTSPRRVQWTESVKEEEEVVCLLTGVPPY